MEASIQLLQINFFMRLRFVAQDNQSSKWEGGERDMTLVPLICVSVHSENRTCNW